MLEGSLASSSPLVINGAGAHTVMPNTWTRAGIKTLCFAAVAIEPFFSWFLAGAARDGITQLIKDFVIKNPPVGLLDGVETASYIMAGFNLYCDYISVTPARDADELIDGLTSAEPNGARIAAVQKALTIGLMIASIVLSFPQGAAADNIPISDAIFDKLGETAAAYVLNYTALVVIGLLGTVYYTMFNYGRMKEHMGKAIEIALNPKDFAKAVFSNKFLGYLEVGMQASANTLYRAVNFGFLVSDEIQHILRKNNKAPLSKVAAWATMVETGVLTLFTRTLSAHKHFLNPDFKYVADEARNLNGLRLGTISDVVLSLIRGVGIGTFTYWMFSQFSLGYGIAYPAGFLSMAFSLTERYSVAKHEKALDAIGARELARRKRIDPDNREPTHVPSAFENAGKVYNEIGKALHYPLKLSEIHSVFSFMFLLWAFTLLANFIARTTRLISFYGFANQLSETLSWGFSNKKNAALTAAAGGEVTKNDFSNFRESNDNAIRDYRVSYFLQQQRDEETHNTGVFAAFTRVFRTVWNASPGSYTRAELETGLRRAQQQDEENQRLLPQSAGPAPGILGGGDPL